MTREEIIFANETVKALQETRRRIAAFVDNDIYGEHQKSFNSGLEWAIRVVDGMIAEYTEKESD